MCSYTCTYQKYINTGWYQQNGRLGSWRLYNLYRHYYIKPWKWKKDHKGLVLAIIWQQIGQPTRNKFSHTYNLSTLNQEEIESMNRPIINKKSEPVIKKHWTKEGSGPDAFTCDSYQTFRNELIPILLKQVHTIEERMLQNPCYEASTVLISKSKALQELNTTGQ